MNEPPEELPAHWIAPDFRRDGYSIVQHAGQWSIWDGNGKPVGDTCQTCGMRFRTERAARKACDALYPPPAS